MEQLTHVSWRQISSKLCSWHSCSSNTYMMHSLSSHKPQHALIKHLAYLLRHSAEKEGLRIGADGFVDVSDILTLPTNVRDGLTFAEIKRAAENDSKKRFEIITKADGKAYIRATKGHTIELGKDAQKISSISIAEKQVYLLDGETLTPDILLDIGKAKYRLDLTKEAWERIEHGRKVVDDILARGEIVYGINTGFGNFANVVIPADKVALLQQNLIRSHASGVGSPISVERTRMLLALRTNVLAKGRSGISSSAVHTLLAAFNADCLSLVPERGTVGASGDLAPLAHLALGLLGDGEMWNARTGRFEPAAEVLKQNNITPLSLNAKEGLALINGTQFITSLGAEALLRAENAARTADVTAAMTLEALKGTRRAFDEMLHLARPHSGQIAVAARLRALLHYEKYPSQISDSHKNCGRVQDSYTLRCIPQVHGVVHDTLQFVRGLLTTEINSATDNPMVFAERNKIISGGNFHGEYPAKAMDYLAIAIHEIANISERRVERLVNPALSDLPAFLVKEGGLNSGFMIAHCAAAALTSENKTLVHPASSDTISTSAAKEDHVSMGGWAARKALDVVGNVESVVAIELLCACQGIDLLRPLKTTEPLERIHALVRQHVKPWDHDRYMKPDIDACTRLVSSGLIWDIAKEYM